MINQIKYLIPPPKIWSWGVKKKTDDHSQGMKGKKEMELMKEKEVETEPEKNRASWRWIITQLHTSSVKTNIEFD